MQLTNALLKETAAQVLRTAVSIPGSTFKNYCTDYFLFLLKFLINRGQRMGPLATEAGLPVQDTQHSRFLTEVTG